MSIVLSVDVMGGDASIASTLPACTQFLQRHAEARLLLVGTAQARQAAGELAAHPRCEWVEASEVVEMHDPVELALRRKKDSSMRVAAQLVKDGRADAMVSSGNTGALMAVSRYVLKTLDGIDRPAIASQLPSVGGGATTVLDLGANVDCSAEHLLQFAIMGSALVAATSSDSSPTVGLLNVGEEVIKGSEVIKQAGVLLRQAAEHGDLNFYGNVEGNDIFKGTVSIVVCDGFVGNVALKAAEGTASMIGSLLKSAFGANVLTQMAGLVAMPVLKSFKNRVDPRRYNGAALLGLRGLVFKSHGSADAFAFGCALDRAHEAASNRLLDGVRQRIAHAQALLTPAAVSALV